MRAGSRDFGRTMANALVAKAGVGVCLLGLLPAAGIARAETLRVTSWNLEATGMAGTNGVTPALAEAVRQLNPDVILLQGVRDWQSCRQLAGRLKPATYSVLVCSSFAGPPGGEAGPNQVAILARQKAYSTWSEPWAAADGGFGFAALQKGDRRLGFFTVQLGGTNVEAAVDQIQRQLRSVRAWQVNQVQTFALGACFGAGGRPGLAARLSGLLGDLGFENALLDTPAREANALSWQRQMIFADLTCFQENPQTVSLPGVRCAPVTCDLELNGAKVGMARAARAERLRAETELALARKLAFENSEARASRSGAGLMPMKSVWWWAGGFVGGLTILWVVWRRRRRPLRAVRLLGSGIENAGPSSLTVVIAPGSVTGSAGSKVPAQELSHPVIQIEGPEPAATHSGAWHDRPPTVAVEQGAPAMLRQSMVRELGRWLKETLVRKLIFDRNRLLQGQQVATARALQVDQRMAHVEALVQQQTKVYQEHIDQLTRELTAAKEESRELIRARIHQVKLEMQAARERVLAEEKDKKLS